MSLVQLTLRPPPHVDFVSGYPGIPPNGTDRPQAAVKGALEVRVPSQGVKAQWVKVELRKVETLPGGGTGNTFYDIIGPGTVTLWTSGGAEYEVLHARDFPFSIRIPESVPPSLHLEQRAGIQYELVATVCTKGKKNFFRKRKYGISATTASVIIDKHDLHSTWPVYCQPESRQIVQDGVKLTVDRNQSCYGPGDRMAVTATMRSESVHTVMLRSFEIFLKETITFRGHMFVAGKKGEPLTKATIVSENRFQVNTPMHGGMQATQDLYCMLSQTHTNTTLSAARHVDITYTLIVKAHLGSGMPLVIELPVIVSNWQRSVSQEAMRRIGPAPGLSMIATPAAGINPLTQQPITRVEPIENRTNPTSSSPAQNPPTNNGGNNRQNSYTPTARAEDAGGSSRRPNHMVTGSMASMQSAGGPSEFGGWSSSQQQRKASDATNPNWLSATEEKQRYEQAKARVDMVQGGVPQPVKTPPPIITQPTPVQAAPAVRNGGWLSAEEEKTRLFQSAQAAVARTQGYSAAPSGVDPAQTPAQTSSSSKPPSAAAMLYSQAVSAMRNDPNRPQSASSSVAGHSSLAAPGKAPRVPGYLTAEEEKAALKRYEDAKKAVDRIQNTGYYEDTPQAGGSGLVSYDALYPSGPSGSTTQAAAAPPPPANDLPPPFEAGPPLTAPQQLSEKERLRRAYEAQDAAALSRQASANASTAAPSRIASPAQQPISRRGTAGVAPPASLQLVNPSDSSPPPFSDSSSYSSAAAEKEALRRRFEAQDTASIGSSYQTVTPPQTPPRSTSGNPLSSSLRSRPAPLPPAASGSGSGQRVMTAAEEKAMLKARYESQDAGGGGAPPPPVYMNGRGSGTSNVGSSRAGSALPSPTSQLPYVAGSPLPGPPPPLMPRPPQEYIQETQEEDARVARLTMLSPMHGENGSRADVVRVLSSKGSAGNMRNMANVMPPLPPKPVGE